MDAVRYIVALVVLVTLPPGIAFWYLAHPLAGFWRRVRPAATYSVLVAVMLAGMAGMYAARRPLLQIEFGTHYALMGLGVLVYAWAIRWEIALRRHLTLRILTGVPELSSEHGQATLLTEGSYARVRHPRYVTVMVAILGFALFTNYLAVYALVPLTVGGLYLVVVLEERELVERLGEPYERYRRSVPMFVPGRRGAAKQRHATRDAEGPAVAERGPARRRP
ncbi:MAG: methyltransferase family protein [Gemmatimonadota bacterium]